ncbi:pilus assembly protein PilP [Salinisphaera hydrothermalis]|uniref:Type 4 fimbrial biogenesis protein PilP n=1 Tax=Salinisphaera hydrothermalis (strain C41B8) TaxID=1304275 RepID=A0A084IRC5_SALHC|nr:pilus assembly protein PilP [Salinisphaera hydrothermalis]KEZ79259.1 type 4 fimbrial biogenesis protein PilP [Salinisphaera hydrothermalis C41B8]
MSGRQRIRRGTRWVPLIGLCAVLAACGSNTDDLQAFVARTKARPAPPVEPMPKIATYEPYTYKPDGRRSPFAAPDNSGPAHDNGVRPNLDRPLDPLEQYPLDALRMVGTITSDGVTYALIAAPDQVVHRVAPGDHMGRHYGRVDTISPAGVTLTEIVPDGNGGYVKQGAALAPPQ